MTNQKTALVTSRYTIVLSDVPIEQILFVYLMFYALQRKRVSLKTLAICSTSTPDSEG